MVKNPPAMWETWVWSLGQEDPLEEGMATHSVFLRGESAWTEEPGGLQSLGSQRVGHDWATEHCIHPFSRGSSRPRVESGSPAMQQILYQLRHQGGLHKDNHCRRLYPLSSVSLITYLLAFSLLTFYSRAKPFEELKWLISICLPTPAFISGDF